MSWKSDTFRVTRPAAGSTQVAPKPRHQPIIEEVVERAREVARDNREKLNSIHDRALRESVTK